MKRENYGLLGDYEAAVERLKAQGYTLVAAAGMGPRRGEIDRYEFELMGLPDEEPGSGPAR